jgi:hypothetical protein
MKKLTILIALVFTVSIAQAAEKPWYVRFAEWFECTWVGANMIRSECIKNNYMAKDLIGRKTWHCTHREYHGTKDGVIR